MRRLRTASMYLHIGLAEQTVNVGRRKFLTLRHPRRNQRHRDDVADIDDAGGLAPRPRVVRDPSIRDRIVVDPCVRDDLGGIELRIKQLAMARGSVGIDLELMIGVRIERQLLADEICQTRIAADDHHLHRFLLGERADVDRADDRRQENEDAE